MQFNSYSFAVFFAVVMVLHNLPLSWRVRKFNLLIASYLFYAAWNPPFVILIWISTIIDWHIARRLYLTDDQRRKRWLLLISLVANLGLLGFFKYSGFLVDNFLAITSAAGMDIQLAAPDIILPVGISFYTFQTLSYTIDAYYKRSRPWHSPLDYALYVTFFPQLVAGPIVRASEFLPQCEEPSRVTGPALGWGLSLLIIGLFEKNVIADVMLAPIADQVFNPAATVGFTEAWLGTLAFAGQIFCDFAGYSACAIGVALCLGFRLPRNFHFPYGAVGFSDFWRRWHISLSSWLRDYLYIPLGGNRRGPTRTYVNLMLTMLIGGLWHGPAWTFVAWGGLHGLYLVGERLARQRLPDVPLWHAFWFRSLLALLTFALVCFTWVFFRAVTFEQAFALCGAMLGLIKATGEVLLPVEHTIVTWVMAIMVALQVSFRGATLEEITERCPWPVRSVALAFMLVAIVVMQGEDRAFIYFQF